METEVKKTTLTRKLLLIAAFTLLFIILLGLITGAIVYFRLKSAHDPSVTISERSGVYSVPLEYSGDELSRADSIDESCYLEDSCPETQMPQTSEGVSENNDNSQGTNSNSNNNSGGSSWVWRPAKIPIIKRDPISEDVVNILILGVDSTDALKSGGRTDTMIVASYNKKTGTVNLISLLRDSFVPIEGHNWNRLNTGYFFGGIGLCINTINDVFELDIQNYVMVDFDSLPKLIDKIGGIEVVLSKAEADYYNRVYNWGVSEGSILLDGKKALAHARNRSVGNADFARTSRQRDMLMRIINKMLDKNDLPSSLTLLNSSLDLIKTNMSPSALAGLAANVYTGPKIKLVPMRMPVDNSFEPYWYKSNMLVTKIDIQKNRDAIRKTIYGQ